MVLASIEHTQGSHFRGFRIEGFHCIQRYPHFQEVRIKEFHCIQRCPHFQGVGLKEFHLYTDILSHNTTFSQEIYYH